jgi:hypothetical protein
MKCKWIIISVWVQRAKFISMTTTTTKNWEAWGFDENQKKGNCVKKFRNHWFKSYLKADDKEYKLNILIQITTHTETGAFWNMEFFKIEYVVLCFS